MERQLRCQSCSIRIKVELNDLQLRALQRDGVVDRFCRSCGAVSRWVLVEPITAGPASAQEPSSRGRVLLIDDDLDILTVLSKALMKEDFEMDTARSARDAIMRLARDDYDVILSDIRMPEFDGKQLFSFLDEKMPEYKQRVIFLTGDTGSKETMDFLKTSKAPYLIKPIDFDQLRNLIQQTLAQGSRSEE
jgi:CheY-like chemotaxis protein